HDLAVLAAFEHGLEPGAERECRLTSSRAPAKRDDPDLRIEQQVERDPLLSAPAAKAEHVTVAADQAHRLVRQHAAESAAAAGGAGVKQEAGVAGQVRGGWRMERARLVQLVDFGVADLQLGHAGPARVWWQLGPVLLRLKPDGSRLDPQRQILADQDDAL